MVISDAYVPVIHIAGVEAVEVVEPETIGPAIEWTSSTVSQAGVLWFLPIHAVIYPFCRITSPTVPQLRGNTQV